MTDPTNPKNVERCPLHPAYWSDYCPICGTATEIGGKR